MPSGITSFDLPAGRVIGGKYIVDKLLGAGWEGEVYRIVEYQTGAARAAKLFFPHRNEQDRTLRFYAKKLEQLRDCPIVIKYHHSEQMIHRGQRVNVLISEYFEGQILEGYIARCRGKRLPEYEAMRIFYEMARGLEQIHAEREYHGDLHASNVMVQRRGVHFDVRLVDLFDLGRPSGAHARSDILDLVRLLYDMLGGRARYSQQRPEIRQIIGGLKHSIILARFPTARRLREHLDRFEWERM
ncbi:MAG: protein kinase domain-containing protein [Planctomycetota bacterium]|jgi:serine/threonine protein kinase